MSGASITRSQAWVQKRLRRSLHVISALSQSRRSGNCFRRRLPMIHEQNTIRQLYRRLLALYPRAFREQLAESMEQTFQDLWNDKRQTKKELFGFVLWTFIE